MDGRSHYKVLIVDDDQDQCALLGALLAQSATTRFNIESITYFQPALAAMQHNDHDVCLMDYQIGNQSGLDLLRQAIAGGCQMPVIMITGHGDQSIDVQAMEAGAADYLDKAEITAHALERSIRYAVKHASTIEALRKMELAARDLVAFEERQRLARELHDSVSQTLFTANVIAETLPRLWKNDPTVVLSHLDELARLTRNALDEMRTLLMELRPDTLQAASLSDLLTQLARAFSSRIQAGVTVHVKEERLPSNVRICFYRIAQEALNNVAKHAQASKVTLSLENHGEITCLRIIDNGSGFERKQVPPGHLGLKIMQERADNIGAHLEIVSTLNLGTEVSISWPGAQTE